MTPETLIAEGRRLSLPCIFLRPGGNGSVAAVWFKRDRREIDVTGLRCWMAINARFIPCMPHEGERHMMVFTDEEECKGGRVDLVTTLPERGGINLYGTEVNILPPIEVVFAKGSEDVQSWLLDNNWPRFERYNSNFPDRAVAEAYLLRWQDEYPVFLKDKPFAVIGGWHLPCADDDWYELMEEELIAMTVQDSEPWVEVWRFRNGSYGVIRRVT